MASQLRVDEIIASTGSSVAIGTAGGSVTLAGDFTVDTSKGLNVGTGATIFSPSSNVLTLGTNSAERVRIDSSGNVGIGTDDPGRLFQVFNASTNPQVNIKAASGGTCELQFGDNADDVRGNIVYNCTDDYLSLHGYNNAERLRITSGGDVGIGLTNPQGKLEIAGNASSTTQFSGFNGLRIHNTNGAAFGVSADMYFTAGTLTSNRGAAIGVEYESGAGGNDLYFATNPGSVTNSDTLLERLRITSSGDVGIGTDNPAGRLEVYNGAGLSSLVIQTPAGSDAELEFRNTNGGNATWSIGLDYDDSKKFKIAYASANGASLSANELIAISTGGNIELASGAGIDFSATANGSGSTSSELLDDYEEGTWTPDLRFGGSNTGVSYSWRNGHYTKIGRQVTVRCAFGLTSKGTFTATARAAIYGLPYDLDPYNVSGGFNYSFVGSYSGGVEGIHVIEHQYGSAYVDHFLLSRITAVNTSFSEMQYQHVGGTQRIAFVTTYFTTT